VGSCSDEIHRAAGADLHRRRARFCFGKPATISSTVPRHEEQVSSYFGARISTTQFPPSRTHFRAARREEAIMIFITGVCSPRLQTRDFRPDPSKNPASEERATAAQTSTNPDSVYSPKTRPRRKFADRAYNSNCRRDRRHHIFSGSGLRRFDFRYGGTCARGIAPARTARTARLASARGPDRDAHRRMGVSFPQRTDSTPTTICSAALDGALRFVRAFLDFSLHYPVSIPRQAFPPSASILAI